MKNNTILIIGGAGYIGSVLTKYYLEQEYTVILIDLLRRGSKGIIQHNDNPMFELYNGDYSYYDFTNNIVEIHKPDVIINLAGIVGDKACDDEHELATKYNLEGVDTLIQISNENDIPLFLISTCSVYGTNPNTCDETSITFALSHYADTKMKMEQLAKKKAKKCLIFRLGTMYGWSPNMRYDLVVNRLVHDALNTQKHQFKVFGGKQVRPFLHPLDLAQFFETLFNKDIRYLNAQIYNIVSENLSIEELGELIEKQIPTSKMKLERETCVERSYCCRSYKAYRDLGFTPTIRVRDGIEEIRGKLNGK